MEFARRGNADHLGREASMNAGCGGVEITAIPESRSSPNDLTAGPPKWMHRSGAQVARTIVRNARLRDRDLRPQWWNVGGGHDPEPSQFQSYSSPRSWSHIAPNRWGTKISLYPTAPYCGGHISDIVPSRPSSTRAAKFGVLFLNSRVRGTLCHHMTSGAPRPAVQLRLERHGD